ncbi:conserved hypothetical protein [Methanocella paludicola SANAE]|uniref:DUF354 domain-containing protein n=1 Tax=Methanocella paludicola (strain DSM 17711 / JCM 13418 / NBRC 101707 / SANAE) TaxID=304371 RepID=D1YWL8_METPS|nr:DUF354 domain-containing protein [Methanocella paludicola]BAI60840.1 conserved hypothetical protein [Methanocella paludicola SANAE]
MKIMVNIGHPAQVHLFKNFIWEMSKRGHELLISASDKEMAYTLLDSYGLGYIKLGSPGKSMAKKIINMLAMDVKIYAAARKFKPDIFLAHASICSPQISRAMKKPMINFDDDEHTYAFYKHLASCVCGFSGFRIAGENIIKIDSYKELAYLHPNWYHPDKSILGEKNVPFDGDYVVLRFAAWNAFHDVGKSGLGLEEKKKLIRELEKYARVLITSEDPLPEELKKYGIQSDPNKIHDIIYNARLLVCDSGTMATEAAILGTPTVRCNSYVGKNDLHNFIQLEQKYGLIFNYRNSDEAIGKAVEILKDQGTKREWKRKSDVLLADKIDVTSFMIWLVENYPQSLQEMKDHPEVQYQFKQGAMRRPLAASPPGEIRVNTHKY